MSACCSPPPSQRSPTSLDRWVRRDQAGGLHVDLLVPGVHCGQCIRRIEEAVKRQPGVTNARLNLSTRRLAVDWREGTSSAADIIAAVADAGYEARPFAPHEAGESDDALTGRELLKAMAVAGFAAANVMLLSVSVWSGAEAATRDLFHWISALIALPAVAYAGRPFFRSAGRALRSGSLNMDVPISLGVILACAMSLYETIHSGPHAYFDAAITLLFLLLIGRYGDHLMRAKARSAVTDLLALSGGGATVIGPDGSRAYLPVSELAPGMHLAVAAGERIPADGEVVAGSSDVDRAPLTGEPVPEAIGPGGAVHAGTMNLTGPLTVRVTAAGEDTLLAEIVRLMEAAEQGRSRHVDLARRAARIYSPLVHALAALTFAGWLWWGGDWHQAVLAMVALLIITCPCALGLAVPAVQVVASGTLFRRGILVKSGTALERLSEIDRVAFDKTGTLTYGRPRLLPPAAIGADMLAIAFGMARDSRHPLARAIASFAADRGITPASLDEVREIPGQGLVGRYGNRLVKLGSRAWCGLEPDAGEPTGWLEACLKIEGRPVRTFHFEDDVRDDAVSTIAGLARRGLASEILSGDRAPAVALVAARLGVGAYRAEWRPQDKAAYLAGLADSGHKVLMVGDGINDAPALAAAHVSMAPATASDIGRTAADLVFTGDDLGAIVEAYDVARAARRLILQNFALAALYNAVAVPVAMAGYVTPLIAAIAMSTSSLIVTGNALRLTRAAARRPDRQRVTPPADLGPRTSPNTREAA